MPIKSYNSHLSNNELNPFYRDVMTEIPSLNTNLITARREALDEFYTRFADIKQELSFYPDSFSGKTVLCNCDDPRSSNFTKYFIENFHRLKLKKLISSCYIPSETSIFNPRPFLPGMVLEYYGDPESINIRELKGDGDFRNSESIEFLKESDVVVSNPPFSLFREYFQQLVDYDKKFLIVGGQNAITYKQIHPFFISDKLWIGYTTPEKFRVPNEYGQRENRSWLDNDGVNWRSLGNVCWFTNLVIDREYKELILTAEYDPKKYLKYDNCDAIEVPTVADIPSDYFGVMGVPITYIFKHNPHQFKIIKFRYGDDDKVLRLGGRIPYARFLIQRK